MDRDETQQPPEPGTRVGLGQVVENPGGLGQREPRPDEGPLVEEASEASFPASDPPVFMSDPATPAERHRTELPDPRETP